MIAPGMSAVLLARQPDGTMMAFQLDLSSVSIDFDMLDPGWSGVPIVTAKRVTIEGRLHEGRIWTPGDEVRFEDPALAEPRREISA